jgi:hypothetical protein
MRTKLRWFYVCIFVSSAIAGAMIVSNVMVPQTDTRKKVACLIATRFISIGERINDPRDCCRIALCSEEDLPADPVTTFEDLKGAILKYSRSPGDFVCDHHIFECENMDIPEGFSVIRIAVKAQLLPCQVDSLPGSYLDLHWLPPNGAKEIVLLKEVLVVHASCPPTEPKGFEFPALATSRGNRQIIIYHAEQGLFKIVKPERIDAFVARRDLAIGETLDRPRFFLIKTTVRKDSAPENLIAGTGDIRGRKLTVPVRKGEPITQRHLAAKQ